MSGHRDGLAAATALLTLLVGCTILDDSSTNLACELVGAAEASEALQREVEARPSPIQGFFVSCDYYLPGERKALADLDLYDHDAKSKYEAERAGIARGPAETAFRDEDIGVPAYSRIEPDGALAGALDGDRYYRVGIFSDRYGETPERAREALVRLLQAAVAQ